MNSSQEPPFVPDAEALRVMRECNRESFWQRSVPFGLAGAMVPAFLINAGKLTKHPKYGVWPKAIPAVVLGFLIGKVSYIPHCREKILREIPNSNLADKLRSIQTGNNNGERLQFQQQEQQQQHQQQYSSSQAHNNNRGQMPMYNPPPQQQPAYESTQHEFNQEESALVPESSPNTSYAQLRAMNRHHGVEQSRVPPYQQQQPPLQQQQQHYPYNPPAQERRPEEVPRVVKRTNKYGDEIED